MKFGIEIKHSVDEIDQELWNHLSQGQPFTSYHWYRFGEKVLIDDDPIYIILTLPGKPVARATFWLMRQEPLPIPPGIVHTLLQSILRRRPLMVCRGPLVGNTPGLVLPEPPMRSQALRTISEVAQELAQQHKASFLLFDYLNEEQTRWRGWSDKLAPATLPDPGTMLPIAWPDFDSYLRHMSKSVRKDYRRHRNRAADLNIQIKHHGRVTRLDEALQLIRNVERRHNTPPNPWIKPVLEQAHMVENLWLTAEIDGRLVGCGLLLGDQRARCLTVLGLDYDVQYVYFQLVYHALQDTIENGGKILLGGGGAYEMKKRLGFHVQDNHHIKFSVNNRIIHRITNRWIANLN